jgi:aryl-alcohol dehydrogenase-like predicted oxidoreductase
LKSQQTFVVQLINENKIIMDYRLFGNTGMRVPVLSLGTGTFGGTNEFFKRWGTTDVKEASRLIDISLDHGLNFFDTANVYSLGASEEILGKALVGRRDKVLIASKVNYMMGDGPNDRGSSRLHILHEIEASLKRLATDYIDVYFIHGIDSDTPIEETLFTLDQLVRSGKVRYIGISNHASWQVMKALAISDSLGLQKYAVYQGYYSIIGRDYEWDLKPLLEDQRLGLMVWSPLGWGRLTGRIRRDQPANEGRIGSGGHVGGPIVQDEFLYTVIETLDQIALETGKTIPQIAINWLLQKRTVTNVVIGARNEAQLVENLGSIGWALTAEQVARIDVVSAQRPPYPHWIDER